MMSQDLCVNQRNEPSHMIVEILLNNMCTLSIISVFTMIYLKPMIRKKYVYIQYFKLLFKLNEQIAQMIIWPAWNLRFIYLKKIVVQL